jgi:two-component system sensor histidine kinase/response regulator
MQQLLILLVEDHPINQMIATNLLEQSGYKVVLAKDGQEAVDLFPTARWGLVLMDLQMPVMGGLEATRMIRAMEPAGQHMPIVAMTANDTPADRQDCLAAGMDDYLPKPVNASALLQVLARFAKISNAGSVLPSSTSRNAPPPVEI